MRTLVKPLLLVLAVPVLVSVLGMSARSRWDARWMSSLALRITIDGVRPDSRVLARYSLATLCTDGRASARFPACRTYVAQSGLIRASAFVGATGFGFLGVLLMAASACRAGARRMAWLLKPSLVVAAAGTALLTLANGLLAVGGVVVGWAFLVGSPVERASTSLILLSGTAVVLWAAAVSVVAFGMIRKPSLTIVGHRALPTAQPRLAEEVGRIAVSVGADISQNIVLCLTPWVAVTEAGMTTLDGPVSGRTLCLSLPLCRILSIDELRALLAHELAHFSGAEAFVTRVASTLAGTGRAVDRFSGQAHGIRAVVVVPPVALFASFLEFVQEGRGFDEAREARADRVAAAVVGADALGTALAKAHMFAPAWDVVRDAMVSAVRSRTQYANASAVFQEVAASNAGPDRAQGLGLLPTAAHPTDRHPSLAGRLDALGVDRSRVASNALVVTPYSPAIDLIEDAEAIERALSAAEHQLIAATL